MSKKDYQTFAVMAKDIMDSGEGNALLVFTKMVMGAARMFKNDNPAFRPVQFFIACGFTPEQAGGLVARL